MICCEKRVSKLILLLTLIIAFTGLNNAKAPDLAQRLTRIAAYASMPLKHACRDAITSLKQSPDSEMLRTVGQHLLSFITTRSSVGIEAVELPLDQIIAMLESQEIDAHLHPTTLQSSAKRILFRTMVELFFIHLALKK